jgi:hypothetical protein
VVPGAGVRSSGRDPSMRTLGAQALRLSEQVTVRRQPVEAVRGRYVAVVSNVVYALINPLRSARLRRCLSGLLELGPATHQVHDRHHWHEARQARVLRQHKVPEATRARA